MSPWRTLSGREKLRLLADRARIEALHSIITFKEGISTMSSKQACKAAKAKNHERHERKRNAHCRAQDAARDRLENKKATKAQNKANRAAALGYNPNVIHDTEPTCTNHFEVRSVDGAFRQSVKSKHF